MAFVDTERIFQLPLESAPPARRALLRALEMILQFPRLNRQYAMVSALPPGLPFADRVLMGFQSSFHLPEEDIARIPRRGPLVVVANHPFGGIEGVIMTSLFGKIREDFRLMSNYMLEIIPEMRRHIISVNPFGGGAALRANLRPIKECLGWLRDGGALIVFPSGTVSHFHLRGLCVKDPEWNPGVGGLIRRARAAALPVYFHGRNGLFFQAAGLLHPRLRTILLPREILNKRKKVFEMRAGEPVAFDALAGLGGDAAIIRHLRERTYALGRDPA